MAKEDVGAPEPAVSAERLHKAEEFIEQEEGAFNRFGGWLAGSGCWVVASGGPVASGGGLIVTRPEP